MIEGQVFDNINMNENLGYMRMLHPPGPHKMEVVVMLLRLKLREGKEHHLRDTGWIFAEHTAMEGPVISPPSGGLLHMMHNCLITKNFVCNLTRPHVLWNAFNTELHMKWNDGLVTEVIQIPSLEVEL
jgi:hypothetical protein